MQHDDPAYLSGLNDLDRARAIVAVRWMDYVWVGRSYRGLKRYDPSDGGNASPDVPVAGRIIAEHRCMDWGTTWAGTASLMTLAESKGWRLSQFMLEADKEYILSFFNMDWEKYPDVIVVKADTIHAAVLLACNAACQREAATNDK